jgi:CheY-like chemotaxis protein
VALPSALPCVLIVADRERVGELVAALSELPHVEVLVSSGGDDTIDLFEARQPVVVVMTASLQIGDTKSLIVTLRSKVPRAEVAIVVIGDDVGPIRTALDALDLGPDRFVTRPLSPKALRFAVKGGIDAVRLVRGSPTPPLPPLRPVAMGTTPGKIDPEPAAGPVLPPVPPVPVLSSVNSVPPVASPVPDVPGTPDAPVSGGAPAPATRAALRARWEALADSMVDGAAQPDEPADEPPPLPPPLVITPRRRQPDALLDEVAAPDAWKPGPTDELAPVREPTLILRDPSPVPVPAVSSSPPSGGSPSPAIAVSPPPPLAVSPPLGPAMPARAPAPAPAQMSSPSPALPPVPRRASASDPGSAHMRSGEGGAERPSTDELWSDLMPLVDPSGPAPRPETERPAAPVPDQLGSLAKDLGNLALDRGRRPPETGGAAETSDEALRASSPGAITVVETRDYARELRAKMSMMAQRLFQGSDAPVPSPADHAPRHDHHTEIDLASLGDEPPLGGGGTEIGARTAPRNEVREVVTSPGSWESQVRERGLADSGTIVRGSSDAAMLLAKMFAQGATGRIGFRRDEVETIVYFDRGRPVFASSNEPRDRMGELLLREGKITTSQYERCQILVAESGRRMGEILVDLGYLKRRELLPAVRRHVEDIVYSLFGWERGTYYIARDAQPSTERIRLSRHPAALILEGIRRKLDRTSLERLIGPPSTVLEVRDRERLGGIVNLGDLTVEERGALAGFDGQADLAHVARTAGVDLADVLPLGWGLCVLGLATARRTDAEASDESTALVGETDLAIDRARVRARWQLVIDADYFALLGVRRDATGFEIRRAYQSARRDFAADCFPVDLRRELARELDDIAHVLDEAFRVLRDDRLRQTYLANLVDR